MLDRLDDDDRVVHDEADGEDQPEERQRVEREAEQRKHHERADQRHRHGDDGNERGAPVLKEDVDHEDDEEHGLDERDDDLANALRDRGRRVERVAEVEIRGEAAAQQLHLLTHAFGDRKRVGSRRLVDRDRAARLTVHAADLLIVERAQLDPCDVAQTNHRSVRIRSHRDRAELCLGLQAALRANGVGGLLVCRRRTRADLARWIDGALLLNRAAQVRHGQPEPGEPIGLHPDAHRVVTRAEHARLADAWHAVERVEDVDVGIVGEEERVVGLVRRKEGHHQHRQAGLLPHRQSELADFRRQVRLRLREPVLHVDLIEVRRRVHVERHRQRHRPVVRVRGLHVEHVVDAVHRLLERRGNRLLDGERVGTRVLRRDEDLRWNDLRELRDGKAGEGNQAAQYRDDRDDDGDDWPADEEAGHQWASAGKGAGRGVTAVPSRSEGPSRTTRSPGCNPLSTIQRLPTRAPSVTVRTAILSSSAITRS